MQSHSNCIPIVPGRELTDRIQALRQQAGSSGSARLLVLQARALLQSTAAPSGDTPSADPADILQPVISVLQACGCSSAILVCMRMLYISRAASDALLPCALQG
jgi:hypothetical protein